MKSHLTSLPSREHCKTKRETEANIASFDRTGENGLNLASATTARIEGSRCPHCGGLFDPESDQSTDCPHPGGLHSGRHSGSTDSGDESAFQETVVYREDQGGEPSDGFPHIDDLIESNLSHYRIRSVIGRGSMGRVYRAEHLGLGRTCAIKVLSPGLVERQPQMVERFWAEARAVAGLIHPHVVTVHNLGSDRGYHYLEMEYIPGGISLRESVVREGAFDPLRASVLVRQVALALSAAHRAGLVHRDVKPANVLLTSEGHAKLADFGLVRRLTDLDSTGGPLAGTPTFMAPELFNGLPATPQTDLYAVGVMYFYLLTARLPFAADRLFYLIRQHRKAPIPDARKLAPDVPDEVGNILNRLLAKNPKQRYESAEELADELKVVVGHLRDTESLVREGLDGLDCLIQQGGRDQFRVIVPVPGDRLQEVYLEVVLGRKKERLLSVYSVCAPADARHYEFALKLNAELTYGGLSIREVNGAPMFVMTRAYSRGHVTPSDIRAAVQEIARRGDWVEQQLTSTDLF